LDILQLLHDNKITENQADDYLDQFFGDFNKGKTSIVRNGLRNKEIDHAKFENQNSGLRQKR
jgi:hypothetical protein